MKNEILKLRAEGKSYKEIKKVLNCSSSTISYHCGDGQKEKTLSRNKKIKQEYRNVGNCLHCNSKIIRKNGILSQKYCNTNCQREFELLQRIENKTASNLTLKRYLIKLHGEKCMECGWDKIHSVTKKVPIELEHIDGDSENRELTNLKLLCPNCHSLTPTYKALNIGNGRYKRMKRYKDGKSY